jgi:hypothetical protein
MMSVSLGRGATICYALDATYRQPDLGNHADPVDKLIYILLSTMTTEANYQRTFSSLRTRLLPGNRCWRRPRRSNRGRSPTAARHPPR